MEQKNWNNSIQPKKGSYGENLVKQYLRNNGYQLYTLENPGPHPFDLLAVKKYNNLMFVEVKAKARMNKYYATGIDTYWYNNYTNLTELYQIPLFLFFVDEHPKEKRIYGNFLHILSRSVEVNGETYPLILKDITLFHLSTMKDIIKLSDSDCAILQQYSSRSYDYESNYEKKTPNGIPV